MGKDLIENSVFKSLIKHSLPFLASSLLQTLYGMADQVIIGQYEGVKSTASVAIGSQLMHMITVIIVGLAVGCTKAVSSSGNKEERSLERTLGVIISFFSLLALVSTLFLYLTTDYTVTWLGTPYLAVEGTADYLRICFLGIPFIIAYNVISSIYRGFGDNRTPVFFVLTACIVNIVLDIVFMGKMKMGPGGAALGTVLSQAASVIMALIHLFITKRSIRLKREDFSLDREKIEEMMKIGTPIAAHDGIIQLGFIIITMIMNRRGIIDAAAAGIVEKVISFLILVPSALYSSVAVLSRNALEDNNEKRAKEILYSSLVVSVLFGLVVSLLIQGIASDFLSFFTRDPAVIRNGGEYLRGYVWETIFAGIHFSLSGYFTAMNMVGIPSVHNIISLVFMRIPGVYFISLLYPTNLFPVGLASLSGSVLSAVICIFVYIYIDKIKKLSPLLSNK